MSTSHLGAEIWRFGASPMSHFKIERFAATAESAPMPSQEKEELRKWELKFQYFLCRDSGSRTMTCLLGPLCVFFDTV